MSTTAVETRYTPEQYIARERVAETRSEYLDGIIIPMPGASRSHVLITVNLIPIIGTFLLDRPEQVYATDMRVRVRTGGRYTYPDVVVVASAPQFEDDEFDTLLNPAAIVEVLSPSTEAVDRGNKLDEYRRIGSLREYILVAQDRVGAERYVRRGDAWEYSEVTGPADVLRLESIGCDIPLGLVYAKTPLAGG